MMQVMIKRLDKIVIFDKMTAAQKKEFYINILYC